MRISACIFKPVKEYGTFIVIKEYGAVTINGLNKSYNSMHVV
jgi:hypothetical protein